MNGNCKINRNVEERTQSVQATPIHLVDMESYGHSIQEIYFKSWYATPVYINRTL